MFVVGTPVVLVKLNDFPALNGRVGLITELLPKDGVLVSLRDAFSNEVLFWQVEELPQVAIIKTHLCQLRLHTVSILSVDLLRRPVWRKPKRQM